MASILTHDTYTHAEDGRVCILIDDEWFTPLDAGGEGYSCKRVHGGNGLERARDIASRIPKESDD